MFTVRETPYGWKHLSLRLMRLVLKQSSTKYLANYQSADYTLITLSGSDGKLLECPVCGFALMSAQTKTGWKLEMCSALPIVVPGTAAFDAWLSTLTSEPELSAIADTVGSPS